MHRSADHFNPQRDQRIEIIVKRIAKRRHENHRARRSGLVMVVHDLREPFDEQLAVHVGGFLHVRHVEIAIVVMADVLRVEPRQARHAALQRILFAHVPRRDEFLSVGIRERIEPDDVVQKPHRFRIVAAGHLIHHFHFLLRADRLGGMQSAIDPDDGFAFARQRVRLIVGQSLGMRKPRRNFLIVIELLQVLWRRNDHHVLPPAFFGRPDIDQPAAVAFRRDLVPVFVELCVARDHVIVSNVEAQEFLGRRDFRRGLGQANGSGEEQDREGSYLH